MKIIITFFMVAILGVAHASGGVKKELLSGKNLTLKVNNLKAGNSSGDFYVEISLTGGEGAYSRGDREDAVIKRIPLTRLEKGQSRALNKEIVITSEELKKIIEGELVSYDHIEIKVQLGSNGVDADEVNQGGAWLDSTDGKPRTTVNNLYYYGRTFSEFTISAKMTDETKAQRIERLKKEREELRKQIEEFDRVIRNIGGTKTGYIPSNNVNDGPRLAAKEVNSNSSDVAVKTSTAVGV